MRHVVAKSKDAIGGGMTLLIDVDLDGHRNPVHGATGVVSGERGVRICRITQGPGTVLIHDGVDHRIDLIQPLKATRYRLGAGHLLARDQSHQLGRAQLPKFHEFLSKDLLLLRRSVAVHARRLDRCCPALGFTARKFAKLLGR